MEKADTLARLLAPINPDQPTGLCEEGYEPLEELEDIMLKYGSLHQSRIDWSRVESLCVHILQTQCKHYRVMLHLITYWLIKCDIAGLINSLRLLSGFVEQYWTEGHPRPGEAQVRYRKKLVEQTLFRIDQMAPRLLSGALTADQLAALQNSQAELQQQAQQKNFAPGLKKLASHLTETKLHADAPDTDQAATRQAVSPASTSTKPSTPKLADLGDERQIKRLLFDLADMINQQDAADPLGYQIRRYALWSGLQSTPPLNAKGESELAPPPADVISEYAEQVQAGSNEPELLRKIEKSVVASPLWLTGSVYAAKAAQALGRQAIAQAILQATRALLQRLPALAEAKFRGGVPYIDQTRLHEALQASQIAATPEVGAPASDSRAPIPEWATVQKEWHKLRGKQGIGAVLEQVEQHQQNAATPRQAFYLKLLAAEQMQAAGLRHVAQDLLATTLDRVEQMSVGEWEPDYLQNVQSILEGK